jgi:hypothetical protein
LEDQKTRLKKPCFSLGAFGAVGEAMGALRRATVGLGAGGSVKAGIGGSSRMLLALKKSFACDLIFDSCVWLLPFRRVLPVEDRILFLR